MTQRLTRRQMLQTTAAAGIGFWVGGTPAAAFSEKSANEKLNIAVVGIGGRGRANLDAVAREGNIVALCDVDDERAGDAYKSYPKARKFYDYRRMFDDFEKSIDAVVVSTPDHTHFHPSMAALELGKHVYCEKPMAHNVWECRRMTDLARAKKVATQLGVQRHARPNVHRVVELIKSGVIGDVSEVHCWVEGNRGMPGDAKKFPPVPSHLKWDLWLGPTAERRYSPEYCPYHWRFWWDFGSGETGNWGCHTLDIPFWALDLKHATHFEAKGPPVHPEQTPKSMAIKMTFPARGKLSPVDVHWYHTTSGPEIFKELGIEKFGNSLFIGSKGLLATDFKEHKLYPEEKFADFVAPKPFVPDSPGFYTEWVLAAKGGGIPPTCHFDYSGPMAESVLLGNVAYRAGEGFDWDAEGLTASSSKAQAFIREPYRAGWDLS